MSTFTQKLRVWIPLGTLLALVVAFGVARTLHEEPRRAVIQPSPEADIPPLELPARAGACAGTVTDAAGAPVAGAVVWLSVADELSFTETRADGAFAFDGVRSGERRFGVLATEFEPQQFTLAETAPAALVLAQRRPPVPVIPLRPRAVLRGHVEGAEFELAGCQVVLTPRAPPEELGAPIPARAECDANGVFAFDDLMTGDYTVALLPRWAANGRWPDLLRAADDAQRLAWTHTAAPERELVLEPVAGTVQGVLHDAAGAPLEAALVLLSPAADTSRVWPPISTASDGSFRRTDLPPGKYVLTARAGADAVRLEFTIEPRATRELAVRPLVVAKPVR